MAFQHFIVQYPCDNVSFTLQILLSFKDHLPRFLSPEAGLYVFRVFMLFYFVLILGHIEKDYIKNLTQNFRFMSD